LSFQPSDEVGLDDHMTLRTDPPTDDARGIGASGDRRRRRLV
jgi:hypothetical protein